jgi:chitin disaccharide deacetylase
VTPLDPPLLPVADPSAPAQEFATRTAEEGEGEKGESGEDGEGRAPLLIVNADDYGLTEGVSRAILDAHRRGIVSSTSVLALAPGFAPSVAWLQDAPDLGTGAHLALVGEDPPLLSAAEVPTLVDGRGNLRLSWRQFLPLAAAGRIDPDDIRREMGAQMEAIVGAGVVVDHFDTHQNLHLWPSVRDAVLDLGEQYDVRVIRVTRSTAFSVVGGVVQTLARSLERRCDQLGWTYAQASTGLDEAGVLDESAMISALFRLAGTGASSAELASHPGSANDPALARYHWDYRWAEEHEALCSPGVRAAVRELGWRTGTFADLARRQRPEPSA